MSRPRHRPPANPAGRPRAASSRPLLLPLLAGALLALAAGPAALGVPGAPPDRPDQTARSGEGPAGDPSKVLATVQGAPLTQQEVEAAAGDALRQLDQKRLQLLDTTLRRLIETRLLDLESARRGITRDQLLALEVDGKVAPPTDAEVDTLYQGMKAQLGKPEDQVAGQLRQTLVLRRKTAARRALIDRLDTRYEVRDLLGAELERRAAAQAQALRPLLDDGAAPALGPAAAPVTVVEFSDFECPYCARVEPTLDQVRKTYGDRVRLVYRHFPLPMHPHARRAAEAAVCAQRQGKFWEMHALLFEDQKNLDAAALQERAARLGLDAAAFGACLESAATAAAVKADQAAGSRAGVGGTPALFVNGYLVSGAVGFEDLSQVIDREIARSAGAAEAR